MTWIINDWYKGGHRIETPAPEGSFKTIWGCWVSVCIASGNDCIGHRVRQGAALLVDNETPRSSLENHLNRFSQYFGFSSYNELPIHIYPNRDFLFDRKGELDNLEVFISALNPVYIHLDSLTSMLPVGRCNLSENTNYLGGVIGRELNSMLGSSNDRVTDLVVHTKKRVAEYSIEELRTSDIQSLVRGHGSIVGQGADSAIILKKISEHPNPTRFCIITRTRREAIPMDSKLVYLELKEESYGHGLAHLEQIDPLCLPPSEEAKDIFKLLSDNFIGNDYEAATSRKIVYELALFNKPQIVRGLNELSRHKIILNGRKSQSYKINKNYRAQCNKEYLDALL